MYANRTLNFTSASMSLRVVITYHAVSHYQRKSYHILIARIYVCTYRHKRYTISACFHRWRSLPILPEPQRLSLGALCTIGDHHGVSSRLLLGSYLAENGIHPSAIRLPKQRKNPCTYTYIRTYLREIKKWW